MAIVDVDLADDLADLGAALGILTAGNGAGPAALNEAWFNDPGHYMGAVFADPAQREAVLRLARRRLDDPLDDLDLADVPETQQWVPLASTPAGGLFLVVEDEGPSAVLGLGVRVASMADPHLSVTAHVPVIRAGSDAPGFVLGTAAGTISVAVSVAPGPEAGRALQSGALALSVPTDGAPPSFAIDLVGLRVDASAQPRDLHVDSSEPAGELLDVAVSVLQSLVLDSAADSSLAHLLGLIGLGGDSQLPRLPLADVFSKGTTALVGWLHELSADTTIVRAWLGHLAGLLELDPLTAVTGAGTAEAPYAVQLGVGAAAVAFTLTVAAAAESGDPVLGPGLRVTMPAPSGVPGKAEAAVELAEITVGAVITARPLPSARLIAHLGPEVPLAPGTGPLVETTAPGGTPVRIVALEAGMALDASGRPVLVLAAQGVTVGTHPTYPVVDLTMPDAVLEVAQGALDDVVDQLLATLGNSTEATALLALIGLRRPAGLDTGAPWPHAVSLTAFFSDPLTALRTFHDEVLTAGDWGTLLGELALLLRGGASTPVTGAGAEADPWTAEVATDTIGTAALTASGTGTSRLALGLRLGGAPRPLTDSTAMRLVITAGLLSLEFAQQGGVEVLPAVEAGLEVGDDFPIDLGIVALELGTVAVSLRWTRANGLALRVAVADAVAVIGDQRVALPVPPYDSSEDLPAFPTDFPWPVITRLLGDALLTRGVAWLEGLATLARWDEGLPAGVSFPTATPVGDLAGLPIERLPGDPAGVLRDWVAELLRDLEGAAAPQIAAWIGAITAGTVPGGGPFGVPVGGGGTAADPYSVAIGTASDAAELLVWFEPGGTTLSGVPELLIPAELSYPLDLLEGDPPDPETLATLLRQAANSIPELKLVVDGRPGLGEGLAQLIARLADSDVLIPATAQQLADAVAAHTVEGLTHLEAPLGFDAATHLPAGTDPTHVLYVTEPLPGLAEWPNRGGAALVDLTEAGLAPDALDLTGLAAAGPWFVRLATRVAAGDAERQAARLQRAVAAAVATLPAGATLTVVAHGPAALAARRVAAAPSSGIAHLVTVAAPLEGATFEFLDEPATGDAVRALQALGPLLSDQARENPFAAEGLAIVETLTTLLDSGSADALPLGDYRLAAPAEGLAAGVAGTSVTMTLPESDVTRAIASLVRHAIESGLGRLRADRPADAVGFGARVRLGADEPAAGRVAVRAELRADLHRFRLRDTAAQQPLPRVLGTIEIRRIDGWLAGGPRSDHDPTLPREPRLRWAEVTLVSDSGPSGMGLRSSITLHEAAALGISRPEWTIELSSADGLPEEARILLGRLAAALAETDAGPTAAAVVELFRALGLVEGQGESLGLVVDAAEQLLVDPATAIRARLDGADAALLAALRTLIGPALRPDEDAAISSGGLEIGLRLSGTRAVTLRTATGGLPLAAGLTLDGGVTVTADGKSRADVRLEPSAARTAAGPSALVLHVDPAEARPVTLDLEQSAGTGAVSAELFPQPDTAELTRLLVRSVPAELTRLGLEFAAEAAPEVVEPLLQALGLRLPGDPAGFVRHPAGLLLDPIGWLRSRGLLAGAGPRDAAAVQALVDGLRGALGATGPSGTLPLPWGLVGNAVPAASGGGVTLSLGWPAPQVAGAVDLSATFGVTLPDAGAPTASLAAALGVTAGPGAARVDVAVGGEPALSLSITPTGGGTVVLHIIPAGGGLAGGAAGVAALLPLVLNALTDAGANGPPALQAVGDAVGTLGDALALRTATGFDAAALRALAGDPAGQLVSRIRASVAGADDALPALAAIVAPSLPAGAITVDGAARTVRLAIPGAPLVVSLAVPATGTPQLCGVLTDFRPVTGLSIDGTLCVSPDGLRRLELSAEVVGESLLAVNDFAFFPFAAAIVGPDASPGGDRFELGLWLASPAAADRDALVLQLPVGGAAGVVCRPQSGPDHSDIGPCVTAATRAYLVPLLVDLVASFATVEAALERPIAVIGGSIGDLLDGVLLDRPVATGPFHLDPAALDPTGLLARLVETGLRLAQAITSELAPPSLQPFAVSLFVDSAGGVDRGGVRISAPPGPGLTLVDTGEIAIAVEADARWFKTPPRPAKGGLTLLLVAHDAAGFRLDPELRVEGLGLRVSAPATDKLVDLGMTIRSIAVHAALDRRGAGVGEVGRLGGHLQIDGLGVPLGEATGDNPVAAKILSSGADSSQAGDSTELVPTFSPAVVLWSEAGETTVLVRAGDPPGPWWLPLQRSFGPIYVEQVGVGSEEAGGRTTAVQLLLDGGLSMLGLTVQVDDLSVTLPTATPLQPGTWKLGLAGLGLGLDASGLTIAGGLRERRRPTPPGSAPLPPDYVGMVRVEFSQFGITAIGGYGEFPDGAGSTYTSFFLFGALSAPLGGPPAFFVTGIGAGAGINRRLIVPGDMAALPSFPLIAAMDPTSDLAADPMGSLDRLGETFPAERGALWFAAGIRFTSFVVVESIAVVSAEVGDGLEINLLGLSRMDLPTPLTPMARIELALRARFSTREGVLSIQAQLTDNSWIINESCRLTGGFAYVTWFRTGQFVLTLGGYHPRFAKPPEFPVVPRLGFAWQVSDIVAIKGTSYFALTASCVMAGAELDVSLDAGWLWGRLVAGFDALVSWDPFHYLVHAYATVTVGFKIEICVPFLGCARVSFSMSIGADLEIEGPELRGKAKLDLDVTSFTVRFGATGTPTSEAALAWYEFYDKYLVTGDEQRRVVDATVTTGGLALPAAGTPDDGSAQHPWKLVAEFVLTTTTKAATTTVNGVAIVGAAGLPLGVGPMKVARITSDLRVSVRAKDGSDHTAKLRMVPVLGAVPAAVWETHDGPEPPAEAKVRPAGVGATVIGEAVPDGSAVPLPVDDVDPPGPRHPLPFHTEREDRPALEVVVDEASAFIAAQPTGTAEILSRAERYLDAGVFRSTGLSAVEQRVFGADRAGPPRLAPLTEGIVDPVKAPAAVSDRPPQPPDPPPDTRVVPPILDSQLRLVPPGTTATRAATSVGADRLGGRRVQRQVPPTLAEIRSSMARTPIPAQLIVNPTPSAAEQGTVLAVGASPRTRVSGGQAERRGGLLASRPDSDALDAFTKRLADGVPLRPGDVQVWRLPNSAADVPAQPRPTLSVKGDQRSRLVFFDRGGHVLQDVTDMELSAAVPVGAHRVVLAGLGGGDVGASGLLGWHAATMVAQVSADAYLAPGAVIRTEAVRTVRRRQTVGTALLRAGEAVAGSGPVTTRFTGGLSVVLLALDVEGAVDAALDGLVLGVDGARRAGEPLVVVAGDRTYALFPLDSTASRGPITVAVGSDDRWLLSGVVASTGSAADLSERVTAAGVGDLVAELVAGATGSSVVSWSG